MGSLFTLKSRQCVRRTPLFRSFGVSVVWGPRTEVSSDPSPSPSTPVLHSGPTIPFSLITAHPVGRRGLVLVTHDDTMSLTSSYGKTRSETGLYRTSKSGGIPTSRARQTPRKDKGETEIQEVFRLTFTEKVRKESERNKGT